MSLCKFCKQANKNVAFNNLCTNNNTCVNKFYAQTTTRALTNFECKQKSNLQNILIDTNVINVRFCYES